MTAGDKTILDYDRPEFPHSAEVGATKSHYLRLQFGAENVSLLPSDGCFKELGCLD